MLLGAIGYCEEELSENIDFAATRVISTFEMQLYDAVESGIKDRTVEH